MLGQTSEYLSMADSSPATPQLGQPATEHNVVFHFKAPYSREELCRRARKKGFHVREAHNFCVFRLGQLTFSHFAKSGHVNCSGTRSRRLLPHSLQVAETLFDKVLSLHSDIKIASSTWSGRFGHDRVNVPQSAEELRRAGFVVSLRPSVFPGAVIRKYLAHPTVLLFSNGKYVVIGAKEERSVRAVEQAIGRRLRCFCCADDGASDSS